MGTLSETSLTPDERALLERYVDDASSDGRSDRAGGPLHRGGRIDHGLRLRPGW
jgi:hypothetical protein